MKDRLSLKKLNQNPYLVLAIFMGLGILIYLPSLTGKLVLPDLENIRGVSQIRDLNRVLRSVLTSFTGFTDLTIYISSGLGSIFFKLLNLLIHVFNAFIFYLFLNKIFKKKHLSILISSLFFLIHPLGAGVINFVSYRGVLFVGFFSLLSLYLYNLFKTGKNTILNHIFFLISVFLALSSHITGVILPFLIIIFDLMTKTEKKNTFFTKPFWILGFIALVVKLALSTQLWDTLKQLLNLSFIREPNLISQIIDVLRYIKLIFVPVNLKAIYSPSLFMGFSLLFWLSLALILILVALCFWLYKRGLRLGSFGLILILVYLLFSQMIIPDQGFFLSLGYFPLIGASLFIGTILRFRGKQTSLFYFISSYLLLLLFLTVSQNTLWSNPVMLWEDNLKREPGSLMVYKNYGLALCEDNQTKKCLEILTKAVEKWPEVIHLRTALAVNLDRTGDLTQAEEEYLVLTHQDPDNPQFYFLLGNVNLRQEKFISALKHFFKAKDLDQDYAPAYAGLCSAYGGENKLDLAITYCNQALNLDPDLAIAHQNLYVIYTALKDYQKASFHQKQALEAKAEMALPEYTYGDF
jgi:protein O-mannosyl-transferase